MNAALNQKSLHTTLTPSFHKPPIDDVDCSSRTTSVATCAVRALQRKRNAGVAARVLLQVCVFDAHQEKARRDAVRAEEIAHLFDAVRQEQRGDAAEPLTRGGAARLQGHHDLLLLLLLLAPHDAVALARDEGSRERAEA